MPRTHRVRAGDCVSQLAYESGLFPDTVWSHANNAELREKRENMDMLEPGDELFIPDRTRRDEPGGTGQRHTFRRKGVPARLRMKILRRSPSDRKTESIDQRQDGELHAVYEEPEFTAEAEEAPWADCPYDLTIDGATRSGVTDGDGMLEEPIPPSARSGSLKLSPGKPDEMTIPLQLGYLGSGGEIAGIKRRLANLGFDCGDDSNEAGEGFERAVTAFQVHYGLERTGTADDAVRAKIAELFGEE